jgi:hypothetical protein
MLVRIQMSQQSGFVSNGNVFFSLGIDGKSVNFRETSSGVVLPLWMLQHEVLCLASSGHHVVAVAVAESQSHDPEQDSLVVRVFDANLGKETSVSCLLAFEGEPCTVSVLHVHGSVMLIALGCVEGQCLLVKQSVHNLLNISSSTRLVALDEFFGNEHLPVDAVAVAVRHVAAGVGERMRISSFAYLPNQYLAVGYEAGAVLVHRVFAQGHVLTKHTMIETDVSVPTIMVFASSSRLVVARDDNSRLELIHLSMSNSLVVARVCLKKKNFFFECLFVCLGCWFF